MTVQTLSADERARRARLSGFTAVLVQGVAMLTSIVSVPLTVSYLGPERYGIWLTLNSALMWLYLGQMGLGGNALVTRLSKALADEDEAAAGELVSTSFFALTGIAVGVGLVLLALTWGADWRALFNATSAVSAAELSLAVWWSLFLFLTLFPNTVIDAVFVAHHEGYLANGWSLAANLLSFAGLIYAVSTKASLPWLVVAVFGARLVGGIGAALSLFVRRPALLPDLRRFSRTRLQSLSGLGGRYVVAQITAMGMFQSQPFIISQILGPGAVGVFAVTQRLVSLPLIVVQSLANAHVAAYAHAFSKREFRGLRDALARSTLLAGLATFLVLAALGLVAQPLIRVWTGPSLVPDGWLVLWLSIYTVIAAVVTPASSVLYATERVGRQALYGMANASLTVILGVLFTFQWGLPGLGGAMLLAIAIVNPLAQWRELRAAGILDAKETDA